jgi:hypothetical protein
MPHPLPLSVAKFQLLKIHPPPSPTGIGELYSQTIPVIWLVVPVNSLYNRNAELTQLALYIYHYSEVWVDLPEPRSRAGWDQRRPRVRRCRTRYPRPQFQPKSKLKGSKHETVVSPQAIVYELILLDKVPIRLGKLFIFIVGCWYSCNHPPHVLLIYFIQHCFICRPLRFHCVGGWCDRTQDCCDFGIGSQTL